MMDTHGNKFAKGQGFLDFSDYGRPVARFITKILLPTKISSIAVTWFYILAGFAAALLIWNGILIWLAALLIVLKSVLDAVDGQLARLRKRPSYAGRYLDAVADFFVNLAVFLAIAHYSGMPFILAITSLVLATLQGTTAHYYEIVARHTYGGDKTSRIDESKKPKPYPWDNPLLLRIVYSLYIWIYGWQEHLMRKIDSRVTQEYLSRTFLSAMSLLGLGWQLLMIAMFLLIGKASWALLYFIFPGTIYMIIIIAFRKTFGKNTKS